MKHFILSLMIILAAALTASARDSYAHDASVLPQAAQNTIKNNFKAKVSVVKIEKTLGHIDEYDVSLSDGTEVSFDRDGNWDCIEISAASHVPDAFIPAGVKAYVSKNHKGARIVSLDKERGGYEVQLSDGLELKFDKNGSFKRYDD